MLNHRFRNLLLKRTLRVNEFVTNSSNNKFTNEKVKNKKDFKTLLQKYKDKIVFSTYLDEEKLRLGYMKYNTKILKEAKVAAKEDLHDRSKSPLSLALQYYGEKDIYTEQNEQTMEHDDENSNNIFQLPFEKSTHVVINENNNQFRHQNKMEFNQSNINQWMTNYDHFDDTQLYQKGDEEEETFEGDCCKQYGTPDPLSPISNVPCGGCGALLHCNDTGIPGYLPSEIFKGRTIKELKTIECQRCHFLKEYNIALDICVQPEEYEKLLQSVINVKAIVLLMVDLLDFPCSIWPDVVDIIGTKRPIVIVGNKVDLLPGDGEGYLSRVKESLVSEIEKTKLAQANIVNVSLISAKSGYGVEDLITKLYCHWKYGGDVFLVGCTNVGKSSLFNVLLQSDFCKVQAIDIVQRATVSRWPGTTLNLLKFPINKLSGWKIHERNNRLKYTKNLWEMELDIRKGFKVAKSKKTESPSLISYIGRTFSPYRQVDGESIAEKALKFDVLDERSQVFKMSRWCYDTPGIVHPDQVLSFLSTEELLLTIPKATIIPRTYCLHEGATIFIAGLVRIDIMDCQGKCCWLTIFCSENLPITVVNVENADRIYDQFIGTELFAVPCGNEERLKNWPGLIGGECVEFIGEGHQMCCGDVVLSSIGWVSVTAYQNYRCILKAWTPHSRGIHRRQPSVLPFSVQLKGHRLKDTPAYRKSKLYVEM